LHVTPVAVHVLFAQHASAPPSANVPPHVPPPHEPFAHVPPALPHDAVFATH
jgi:hypothetical protein